LKAKRERFTLSKETETKAPNSYQYQGRTNPGHNDRVPAGNEQHGTNERDGDGEDCCATYRAVPSEFPAHAGAIIISKTMAPMNKLLIKPFFIIHHTSGCYKLLKA